MSQLSYTVNQGYALFLRELRVRYRRAFLSLLWIVIPTLTASFGAVFAGRSMGVSESQSADYPVRVFCGIMLLQLFMDVVSSSQQLSQRCRSFLRLVPYPPEALLLGGVGFALFSFAIKAVILLGMLFYYGVVPSVTHFLPAVFAASILIGMGVVFSQFLIPISYVYWDLRYGRTYLFGLLLFATPVLYPPVSSGALYYVNVFNPLTAVVLTARDWFLYGSSSFTSEFFAVVPAFGLVFLLSSIYYRRSMPIGIAHI